MTKRTLRIFFAFICLSILGMGVFMPKIGNGDFISAKYGKSTVYAKFNKGIGNLFTRNDLGGANVVDTTYMPEVKLLKGNFSVRSMVDTTYMPEAMQMKSNLLLENTKGDATNNTIMFFMIVGVIVFLGGINRKKQFGAIKENDTIANGDNSLSMSKLDVQFSYAAEIKADVRGNNLQEFFEQVSPIYCEAKVEEKTVLV